MLGLALAILAQAAAPATEPAAATNEARVGRFYIAQHWSDDPEGFLREWRVWPGRGLPDEPPPSLTTTNRIERNRQITSFLLTSGCLPDDAGNCDLKAVVETFDPDGILYYRDENVDVWSGQAPPDESYLSLSDVSTTLVIEDGEKLGAYTVRMAVTDRVANVTAHTKARLMVVEAGQGGQAAPAD